MTPERLGELRAEGELGKPKPPPLDTTFVSPDGKGAWCRFGAGFACLNGDDCLNPNHRR